MRYSWPKDELSNEFKLLIPASAANSTLTRVTSAQNQPPTSQGFPQEGKVPQFVAQPQQQQPPRMPQQQQQQQQWMQQQQPSPRVGPPPNGGRFPGVPGGPGMMPQQQQMMSPGPGNQ